MKLIWKKKRKETKLTADNFFYANDPNYLDRNEEIKQKLIEYMIRNKPEDCFRCIFLAKRNVNDKRELFCPFNEISLEFGKRATGCILDK